MLPQEIVFALYALIAGAIGGFGVWLAGRFKNQADKERGQRELEQSKAELELATQTAVDAAKVELDKQNSKDRDAMRGTVDFYMREYGVLREEQREANKAIIILHNRLDESEKSEGKWRDLAEKRLVRLDGIVEEHRRWQKLLAAAGILPKDNPTVEAAIAAIEADPEQPTAEEQAKRDENGDASHEPS